MPLCFFTLVSGDRGLVSGDRGLVSCTYRFAYLLRAYDFLAIAGMRLYLVLYASLGAATVLRSTECCATFFSQRKCDFTACYRLRWGSSTCGFTYFTAALLGAITCFTSPGRACSSFWAFFV